MKTTPQQVDKTEQLTDVRRIMEFLKLNPVGVLATVGPDHNPHATAIYFGVHQDNTITFITKRGTRKSSNIAHQGNVMLVVNEPHSQTTAQIAGIAEEIADVQQAQDTFRDTLRASLQTSSIGTPPVAKLYAGNYVAYRIKPDTIRLTIFSRSGRGSHGAFETIEAELP